MYHILSGSLFTIYIGGVMKYIIKWDVGYGPNYEVVEADSIEAANQMAYDAWNDDAQSNADYDAIEYSEEYWRDNAV
jgi:hypothetical protein